MVSAIHKRLGALFIVLIFLYLYMRFFTNYVDFTYFHQTHERTAGTPLLVTVYYEALCGDSKHFIIRQLLPAFKQAEPLMEIQMIPYGKAKTFTEPDGTYRFECQHGSVECEGNMYHACAIEAIESTKDRLNVIACMIRDNRAPKEAMHKCTRQYGIENTDLIQKCFNSSHGGELLKLYGEATEALRPPVKFIPTITLDGSQFRQATILKDLLGEVCRTLGETEQTKKYCIS
ncbi:PREDICTED: gamma-interferon-inducible lysosomal thiol reductase [Rhagoletis zephyria]|uniref:gamma-interferon-inducible lysosomal thiol reductase n=1 Tax=Rhagoletis zephyria TaxID=28612 RepID=UPI0008115383|nr:PREDICTED: gamma-interferon-inducible lysosomal thiol reductase [Rhagoletis zephyria]